MAGTERHILRKYGCLIYNPLDFASKIVAKGYTYPSNVPTERRGRPANHLLPTKRPYGTSGQ